jgi:hypothetical protein
MRENRTPLPTIPVSFAIRVARWLVITFAIYTFVATTAGLVLMPDYAGRHLAEFTPNAFWTYEQTQAGLTQLGWSSNTMVWVAIGRSLILVLVMGLTGLLILWRKSSDWFGLYLAFAFLVLGVGGSGLTRPLVERIPGYAWVLQTLGATSWQFFFIAFYFFPNGKPIPRWTRWLVLAWGGYIFLYLVSPETANNSPVWLAFLFVFGALGGQIYRYFWYANAVQRQQTKWIMTAGVLFLIITGLLTWGVFNPPTGPDYRMPFIRATITLLGLNASAMLLPVAITISILFYRLWDIDILIRRTLQYSLLTGLLGLVYFGTVVLLQTILGQTTGERSPLVLVLSTLLIAALFAPLRRRTQNFIDRRFYRQKYDAAKVLADFARTARDETDINQLTARLVEVVQETLQPEQASLWLKPTNDGRRQNLIPTPKQRRVISLATGDNI